MLSTDYPVPCRVVDDSGPESELSLTENVVRAAMHPADQVEAFAGLAGGGATAADIAMRFGVTEKLVEQRLRLGNAAPVLLDAYREGDIDLGGSDRLRGHRRPGPPDRGLGAGEGAGLPTRRLADQTHADRRPGCGKDGHRPLCRHRGL